MQREVRGRVNAGKMSASTNSPKRLKIYMCCMYLTVFPFKPFLCIYLFNMYLTPPYALHCSRNWGKCGEQGMELMF